MENNIVYKRLLTAGFILIIVELGLYLLMSDTNSRNGISLERNGGFFINFILTAIYFIVVLAMHRPFFHLRKLSHHIYIITLVLFSVSAFTLNNVINIFAQFSDWVIYYLVIFYIAFILSIYIEKIPKTLRIVNSFILGAGSVLVFYFAVYLAPMFLIGLLGLLFFGMSIHVFVPLLIILLIVFSFNKLNSLREQKIAFIAGTLVPVLFLVVFLFQWKNVNKSLHVSTSSVITRPDNNLPVWVLLCQNLPSDAITQKIIAGDLLYDTFSPFWGRNWNANVFNVVKKHDPLVNVGLFFFGDINLDEETRIKVLKSQYNARHQSQRKLWSDENLETSEVLTNIKVFPEYRIAYTEKIITIKNFNFFNESQQEAAYTFYLPEGSVATSLSLWIDGKEEKSRLTTKEKADSAYVSVVGVERRDPALLHWQEGNTLTVTVFPCTPSENRQFKIGITTPLIKNGEVLEYQNIYFEGPPAQNTLETTIIDFDTEGDIGNPEIPSGFEKEPGNKYMYTGKYKPDMQFSFKCIPLSKDTFCFNNKCYTVNELVKQKKEIKFSKIYLDINKSWSEQDFNTVMKIFENNEVYVFYDEFIRVSSENGSETFEMLSTQNFSLFPFYMIKDTANSLIVSKSGELSPNLGDLEGSDFILKLKDGIKNKNSYYFYNIGNQTSPYIKTLKEFQLFNFVSGDLVQLSDLIKSKTFLISDNDLNKTELDISGVIVKRDSCFCREKSDAPDHLLRLFAYNRIMKEIGRNYYDLDSNITDSLVQIANEGYVVSPISSLIVLETLNDYKRFGIDENENSLKNASVQSSGSVPEPEEWILIIVFGALVILLYRRFFRL